MQIHDCHMWWTSGLGNYVLRPPVLRQEVWEVGIRALWRRGACHSCCSQVVRALSSAISYLLSTVVDPADAPQARVAMAEALYLFETRFPPTDGAIKAHLLWHALIAREFFGPVYTYWMYVFERFMGALSRTVHNRANAGLCEQLLVQCTLPSRREDDKHCSPSIVRWASWIHHAPGRRRRSGLQ